MRRGMYLKPNMLAPVAIACARPVLPSLHTATLTVVVELKHQQSLAKICCTAACFQPLGGGGLDHLSKMTNALEPHWKMHL